MTRTRNNLNELLQATGAALLLAACPAARGDGGSSSVIGPESAGDVYPPSITIEDVMADPALPARGATEIIVARAPTPAAPAAVLIASGDQLGSNAYAVYQAGADTGFTVTLLPRTRASLTFGSAELLDTNGALVAQVQFSAELGTATLIMNGVGHHVLGLFIMQTFQPVNGKPFQVESATLLDDVPDMAAASSFVLQVEAWIAGAGLTPDEGGVAIPVDECQAMCVAFDTAQKETCNIHLATSIGELFAEPYLPVELGPKSKDPRRINDSLRSAAALGAGSVAPGLVDALDAVNACHALVDAWTVECRTVVCLEPQ